METTAKKRSATTKASPKSSPPAKESKLASSVPENYSLKYEAKDIQTKAELCQMKVPSQIMSPTAYYNPEVQILIPEEIKSFLCDDQNLIVELNNVLFLPSRFNIKKVFHDYLKTKTHTQKLPPNHSLEGYKDFLASLATYFRLLLKDKLLYPLEKQQYEYLHDNYKDLLLKLQKEQENSEQKPKKKSSKKQSQNKPPTTNHLTEDSPKEKVILDDQSQTSESTSESIPSSKSSSQLSYLDNEDNEFDYLKFYSPVHLLRLFTILGRILFYTNLNTEEISLTLSYVYDFLKYLNKILFTDGRVVEIRYADSHHYNLK